MAIDKAIDSVKLESNLTSIADAIRSKGGTSGELAFPAGFVSAIEAISAGGGVKMASGTFQLEEDTDVTHPNYYRVLHNLGVQPDLIVLMPDTYSAGHVSDGLCSMILARKGEATYQKIICVGKTASYGFWDNNGDLKTDENAFMVGRLGSTTATKLLRAHGYNWFVFAFK